MLALVASIIIVFYNISRIPVGDEIGATGEQFIALYYTLIIFLITVIFSFSVSSIKTLNQIVWQGVVYGLCIISVYYFTWKVCVFREPGRSTEEIRNIQRLKLNNLISEGTRILEKSENRNHTYKKQDSTAILNYLIHFLDSNSIEFSRTKDSIYHSVFSHFFSRTLMNFDNIQESLTYRKTISNSITVDHISYSPNNNLLLAILTYDIGQSPVESNAIALIGSREDGKLILYKYPCFRNDYGVLNKKYAFYELVNDLAKNEQPCSKGNPFTHSFWDGGYFGKVKVKNEHKYLYQVHELYNQPNKKFDDIPVPSIVIK